MGFIIRSVEHLVGTPEGVFRVTNVRRVPVDERWPKDLVDSIVGTPELPIPESANRRIPTYAKKFADKQTNKEQPRFVPPDEPVTSKKASKRRASA